MSLPEVITLSDSDDDVIKVSDSSDDEDNEFKHFAKIPDCNRPYVMDDLVPYRGPKCGPVPTHPIRVINRLNDRGFNQGYAYVEENVYANARNSEQFETFATFCNCKDGNCSRNGCACSKNTTIKIKDGKIDQLKGYFDVYGDLLVECSDKCACKGKCNRSPFITKAIDFRCELVMTPHAGFACYVRETIAAGSYICEFIGEVTDQSNEAIRRAVTSYTYTIPCHKLGNESIIIDPYHYGNISRFFNHSCEPNLEPFRFYKDDRISRHPHLGFYAARNIAVDEELTISYGLDWWIDGYTSKNVTACFCGSRLCILPESDAMSEIDMKRLKSRVKRKITDYKQKIANLKKKLTLLKRKLNGAKSNGPAATKKARTVTAGRGRVGKQEK